MEAHYPICEHHSNQNHDIFAIDVKKSLKACDFFFVNIVHVFFDSRY